MLEIIKFHYKVFVWAHYSIQNLVYAQLTSRHLC